MRREEGREGGRERERGRERRMERGTSSRERQKREKVGVK